MTCVDALPRAISLAEFLRFEGDPNQAYELIDGEIQMMAPTTRAHSRIAARLAHLLETALFDCPTRSLEVEVGIKALGRDDRWFKVDVAIAAEPPPPGQYWVEHPVLIAEVLSPNTELTDRQTKLPEYRRFPTARDILLIRQDRPAVEHHRRRSDASEAPWDSHAVTGLEAAIHLQCLGAPLPLRDLYRGIRFPG